MKLVAPYVLAVVVLLELLRALPEIRRATGPVLRGAARRVGWCVTGAAATFVALLALLDRLAPPYDPVTMRRARRLAVHAPLAHAQLRGRSDEPARSDRDRVLSRGTGSSICKPITYLNINPDKPAPGLFHVHPAAHFLGVISPAIMLLALPSLVFLAWAVLARRRRSPGEGRGARCSRWRWFLGTFLPFVVLSVAFSRTSYLYYMVVVMPGIYLAVSDVLMRLRRYWPWLALWGVALLGSLVVLYPFTPLP